MITDFTDWFTAKIFNNGGAKERFRPTLNSASHLLLRADDYASIEFEFRYGDVIQAGRAVRNSHGHYYLRRVVLEPNWPAIPNAKDYSARFRPAVDVTQPRNAQPAATNTQVIAAEHSADS